MLHSPDLSSAKEVRPGVGGGGSPALIQGRSFGKKQFSFWKLLSRNWPELPHGMEWSRSNYIILILSTYWEHGVPPHKETSVACV